MQYFEASKIGQERTERSAQLLGSVTGYAKSAVFLRHESDSFEPVGEENMYAVVSLRPPSVVVVLCDAGGNAKAMSQFLHPRAVDDVTKKLEGLGLRKYEGEPYLPA
ncbi:MAG: hypothetical protein JRN39_02220 [Nitrososphaerota archaeon]|nr:hypothetical protein [Nitrososphaerota archaeon]